MVLPINKNDNSYRFFKNLNMDVKLTSNEYGEWDIVFDNKTNDWVNCTGFDSLVNACIIAIMTRFTELDIELYEDFGCRIHELIKANKNKNVMYRIELFVVETLKSIRRVNKVNWVVVEDNPNKEFYNYRIGFSVSTLPDEEFIDDSSLNEIIEDEFYI